MPYVDLDSCVVTLLFTGTYLVQFLKVIKVVLKGEIIIITLLPRENNWYIIYFPKTCIIEIKDVVRTVRPK